MATASFPVFTLPTPAASAPTKSFRWDPQFKAYLVLGAGILFVAWSAILVKWANIPGPSSGFYRAFFAATILIPIWIVRSRTPRGKTLGQTSRETSLAGGLSRRHISLAMLAGVLFAMDLALYNSSILMTSAANATLLGNNAPLVVALGVWAIFGTRPSRIFWIGLSVASIGTVVIVGGDLLAHPQLGLGDLFAILAAVCYAGYLMAVAHVRSHADTLTLVTITVSASAVTLLGFALAFGTPLSGFSASTWLSLIALGVVAQVGGYLAITYALGHLSPTLTSICLLVQAPLTALLAVPMLGESISALQLLGGTLVLGGIYVVTRQPATTHA